MPRWNNDLLTNCKSIMDVSIMDIKPELYSKLLIEIQSECITNNKKVIEQHLRKKLMIPPSLAKHTSGYWIARGWSQAEAYIKSKENTQKNRKSVFSKEFWLTKINPNTGKLYTLDEANFERNSRRPIRKEYWMTRGYLEYDSIILAANTKSQNNKKGANNSKNSSVRKITSKRCIEYYTTRGYSLEDARIMQSESQKFFSKEICIEKYGEIDGLKIWQERQDQWQATLNEKSIEEKSRINRLKLTKGITVSSAERIILNEVKKYIPEVVHQFTLTELDKKQYIYDLCANNKIIEYNGDFWHCNPILYAADYVNPRTKVKAIDKWQQDQIKLQYAKDHGYDVLVVWESEFKSNKDEIIKKCIQFLTT
jgi:hypothetical protein